MDALDTVGILASTDKSSLQWDYLRHYEALLGTLRDAEFNLIELGIGGGNSLMAWERFFPLAHIVGIDLHVPDECRRRFARSRIVLEQGSQDDAALLNRLVAQYPPTVIIDDCAHQAPLIMASFAILWPHLAPGGWYVVEDLNITSRMDEGITPHEHFARAAADLMHRKTADPEIDAVYAARGIVFVRKADSGARDARLAEAGRLAHRTTNPNGYHWLSLRLAERGKWAEAEAEARMAVKMYPDEPWYQRSLERILARRQ
jgi:hypothetical protein